MNESWYTLIFIVTMYIYIYTSNASYAPKYVPVCCLNWRFNYQSLKNKDLNSSWLKTQIKMHFFISFIILWNNLSMAKGSWSNLKDTKNKSFYHINKTKCLHETAHERKTTLVLMILKGWSCRLAGEVTAKGAAGPISISQ